MLHATIVTWYLFEPAIRDIAAYGFYNGIMQRPLRELVSAAQDMGDQGRDVLADGALTSRMAAFWFSWAGFAWVITGVVVNWAEAMTQQPAPAALGWLLLLYSCIGWIGEPVSGFPSCIILALYVLWKRHSYDASVAPLRSHTE